ncbi:MAG TPA: hypothetical protein VN622_14125 [Clostridia bacterium]|nr:hypothetical protein [Clostridia bacterium]
MPSILLPKLGLGDFGGDEVEYLNQQRALEHRTAVVKLNGVQQDIVERKKYALCFFVLACAWVCVIGTILLLQGFGSFWWGCMPFKLSDSVLLTAMGTTTANILGILLVVAKYLFKSNGE